MTRVLFVCLHNAGRCGDQCPFIPGKQYIDWNLPDPKGMPLTEVRRVRDEIRRRVQELMAAL